MNTQVSFDSTNAYPSDLNALSVTGILVQEPDLLVGVNGEITAMAVIAIEGKPQVSAAGTMMRHTFFVHTFAMSPVADWLATMRAGTRLRILGCLDYLYRADAPTVTERVVLAIRIEELALHV